MTGQLDPGRLKQIERAIRKLPREQRDIFCAIRFEDLSYEEIARRTGLSVTEVERLFAAALMNFMRRLDWKPKRWWHRR
jgi:DNA-directed RNA polymerase specialized sigma24 family protein